MRELLLSSPGRGAGVEVSALQRWREHSAPRDVWTPRVFLLCLKTAKRALVFNVEISDSKAVNDGFCQMRTWSGSQVSQNSEDQLNSSHMVTLEV